MFLYITGLFFLCFERDYYCITVISIPVKFGRNNFFSLSILLIPRHFSWQCRRVSYTENPLAVVPILAAVFLLPFRDNVMT